MLRSGDGNKAMEDEPENCYCVVNVFRDHGAERKLSNDKAYVKKRIGKINKQIIDERREFDTLPRQKHKRSMSSGKGPRSDQGLHTALATMAQILSSARPVTILGLRDNMKDDPDLYPICMRAITLPSEGAGHSSNEADVHLDLHSPSGQGRPPKMPKLTTVSAEMGSPSPTIYSPKFVACFYVQFTQRGEQPQDIYYAVCLMNRTSHDLKSKLSEKLQIDPCFVTRILWVNNKGLKVMVDDDMVQQIPEAQIMIADVCEFPYPEIVPSSTGCSEVEVKLVF
ncbi:hypothetical protein N7451_012904 [Penicillium sp. IBT 35674x]|nr:hypothetical protein N7451_012904 [Penicillium sp. IBT 35674x]